MSKYAFAPKGGMTIQSEAKRCDINEIDKRAKRMGYVNGAFTPGLIRAEKQPLFGDFTNLPDFEMYQQKVNETNEAFMSLDPRIRKRFHNNPAEMIEFIREETNHEEAVKLGMLSSEAVERRKEQKKLAEENNSENGSNSKGTQKGVSKPAKKEEEEEK